MNTNNMSKNEVTNETIDKKVDGLAEKIDNLTEKIEVAVIHLDKKIETEISGLAASTKIGFDEVHEKLHKVDLRFDQVDKRLDKVDNRLDRVEYRLDKIEDRLDSIEDNHGTRLTLLESQMKVVYPH
jgi:chromosome segregation ATPase